MNSEEILFFSLSPSVREKYHTRHISLFVFIFLPPLPPMNKIVQILLSSCSGSLALYYSIDQQYRSTGMRNHLALVAVFPPIWIILHTIWLYNNSRVSIFKTTL